MANFFSLGSCSTNNNNAAVPVAATTRSEPQNQQVLLYRNQEIYQKGFEIWQQYVQVHHPKSDLHRPFLQSNGGVNCQDCGNQAKKDCAHSRCRTCCKSRGFDCSTHVKSTWVPAAQRRERQMRLAARNERSETKESDRSHSHQMRKRLREDDEEDDATGLELGQQQHNFPAEVNATALFRCVRVHSSNNATDQQLAYQTAVNINGRLFKGILYDQGPEPRFPTTTTTTSTRVLIPGVGGGREDQHQGLTAAATANPDSLDPSNGNNDNGSNNNNGMYPPAISAFLAGTQFFPPPRS